VHQVYYLQFLHHSFLSVNIKLLAHHLAEPKPQRDAMHSGSGFDGSVYDIEV
jgi:hypothetical protein